MSSAPESTASSAAPAAPAVARASRPARQNGLTETELKEVITHLAFYAGWPRAASAIWMDRRAVQS